MKKFQLEVIRSKELVDFEDALVKQKFFLNEIIDKKRPEMLWFLEHEHIYTSGRNAKDDEFLGHKNFDKDGSEFCPKIVQVDRGGKYTYHGPGQLIIYLFLNLKNIFYPREPDLLKFIQMLEEWIIISLSNLGVKNLTCNDINHGIWIRKNKLSAVGIHLKRWVTNHGISININPDLKFYEKIIPCGVLDYGVTSLENEKYKNFSRELIEESLLKNFNKVFENYKF